MTEPSRLCVLCAFHKAGSSAHEETLGRDIVPLIDGTMELALEQRREIDNMKTEHKVREDELLRVISTQHVELCDAKDEIADLREQLDGMTDLVSRLQPALRMVNTYKKALREATDSLERIKDESVAAESVWSALKNIPT